MATATSTETIRELTEEEVLNRMVPRWARVLNVVYEHTFAHFNRFVEWLDGIGTRRMIAEFDAAEERKAADERAAA